MKQFQHKCSSWFVQNNTLTFNRCQITRHQNLLLFSAIQTLPPDSIRHYIRPINAVILHIKINSDYILQILNRQLLKFPFCKIVATYTFPLCKKQELLNFFERTWNHIGQVLFFKTVLTNISRYFTVTLSPVVELARLAAFRNFVRVVGCRFVSNAVARITRDSNKPKLTTKLILINKESIFVQNIFLKKSPWNFLMPSK